VADQRQDSLEAALDMNFPLGRVGRAAFVAMTLATVGTMGMAQESTNRVATMTDWNVFTEPASGTATECWGVSKPKETVNTRDGQPVSVRRGDILLFVTFRPGKPGEISFTGGYPFAAGSTVEVQIDGTSYQMFSDGEWAWPGSAEEDAKMLAALKAGTSATLTARSGKGTQTVDTFSLRGFTAAMEDAAKRCG
jgi:Invasion associated locus B (IalB) protein